MIEIRGFPVGDCNPRSGLSVFCFSQLALGIVCSFVNTYVVKCIFWGKSSHENCSEEAVFV